MRSVHLRTTGFTSAPRLAAFVAALAAVMTLLICPAYADSWALLIGIDQYEDVNHINPLGGAAADARAIAKTLHDSASFPEDHIKVLISDGEVKPTRTNILNALAHLANSAHPGDTVFVLYSGHGIDINGIAYLLPYDTSAYDDSTITDSALETSKFRARLKQVKAKALVLAFDMCRSDPRKIGKDVAATDNKMGRLLERGLDFKKPAGDAPATGAETGGSSAIAVTLFSCTEGQRSYEWQDKGRGYFSYYLEEGLKGAAADPSGQVTIGSLAAYIESHVKSAVQSTEHHDQTPYPSLDGPGAAEFVLAAGSAPVIAPSFKVLDTHARLRITVNAPNAAVAVDGQAIAAGADYVVNLLDEEKKTVHVKVTAPGYDGQALDVELLRGVTSPLSVTLAALPPPMAPRPPDGGSGFVAAGTVKINPKDGAEMVYVPGGPFLMGDDDQDDNPRHTVTLSAFYIYKNDVTVAQYRAYCTATGKAMWDPPFWGWKDDHPIVNVSWADAKAYCAWAGCRLPTEAEWEKAARGDKGQKYPWGDEFDSNKLWCSKNTDGEAGSTHSVGGFPSGQSPYGALDMAGNVYNWCEDGYDEDFMRSSAAKKPNPVNESSTGQRVLRGGAWLDNDALIFRAAFRVRSAPPGRDNIIGFRCVAAAGPP